MKKKESKSSKSSGKKSNLKVSDRFLLKKGEELFIVNKFVVDTLPFQEALLMAESTYSAVKRQLLIDATKGDHFVEGMKIVEALQQGLDALYSKHPVLQLYIRDQNNFKSIKENIA